MPYRCTLLGGFTALSGDGGRRIWSICGDHSHAHAAEEHRGSLSTGQVFNGVASTWPIRSRT
eukprot:1740197-Pyramimonas_sp.AAC.1